MPRQCGSLAKRVVAIETGTVAFFIRQEDAGKPGRQLARHFREIEIFAGADGAFDLQIVAVKIMVTLKRLDQEIVQRHPDRAAPV